MKLNLSLTSFDISPFLNPDDPWPFGPDIDEVIGLYQFKYLIATTIQPKSILEIGVRAGYSAAAFLSAVPDASYLGLDLDVGWRYGGRPGMLDWARESLSQFKGVEIRVADTQQALPFELPQVDFAHVDGDHSYEGATRDLELVLTSGARFILVDDITFLPEVGAAVDHFVRKHKFVASFFPTFRGDTLIQTDV